MLLDRFRFGFNVLFDKINMQDAVYQIITIFGAQQFNDKLENVYNYSQTQHLISPNYGHSGLSTGKISPKLTDLTLKLVVAAQLTCNQQQVTVRDSQVCPATRDVLHFSVSLIKISIIGIKSIFPQPACVIDQKTLRLNNLMMF